MATVVYLLAFYYGGAQHDRWAMLKRILKSPLIWSLTLSLLLAITPEESRVIADAVRPSQTLVTVPHAVLAPPTLSKRTW